MTKGSGTLSPQRGNMRLRDFMRRVFYQNLSYWLCTIGDRLVNYPELYAKYDRSSGILPPINLFLKGR